jgi:hypothetical protein
LPAARSFGRVVRCWLTERRSANIYESVKAFADDFWVVTCALNRRAKRGHITRYLEAAHRDALTDGPRTAIDLLAVHFHRGDHLLCKAQGRLGVKRVAEVHHEVGDPKLS